MRPLRFFLQYVRFFPRANLHLLDNERVLVQLLRPALRHDDDFTLFL
jgi:hypothetical protein